MAKYQFNKEWALSHTQEEFVKVNKGVNGLTDIQLASEWQKIQDANKPAAEKDVKGKSKATAPETEK